MLASRKKEHGEGLIGKMFRLVSAAVLVFVFNPGNQTPTVALGEPNSEIRSAGLPATRTWQNLSPAGAKPLGLQTQGLQYGNERPRLSAVPQETLKALKTRAVLPPTGARPKSVVVSSPTQDPSVVSGTQLTDISLVSSFETVDNSDNKSVSPYMWIPPDPIFAVGPNHIVVTVNSMLAVYTKSGALLQKASFYNWFSNVYTGPEHPFDPRIVYDHNEGHFLMVVLILDEVNLENWYLLSVSQTSDPTGAWWNYKLQGKLNYAGEETWADYPDIGFDGILSNATPSGAVYLTSNQFTFSSFESRTAMLSILPKSALYSGAAVGNYWTAWGRTQSDGTQAFTLRTATTFGDPGGEFLINTEMNDKSGGGEAVDVWKVVPTYPPTPLNWTRQANINIGAYYTAPDARQLGGTSVIDTLDTRALNAVYRNGFLYTAFSEAYNWGSGSVSAVRYLKVNTSTNSAAVNATYGADGYYYWMPAIFADSSNNVAMVFARSSSSEYAGIRYTGHKAGDPAGLPSAQLKAGEKYVPLIFAGYRGRWGDYFGIAGDPADSNKIWVFGEWAKDATGIPDARDWGTWAGQIEFASRAAWPAFRRDIQHTGRSPYAGPTYPALKWSYTGSFARSSPATGADGTVYLGSIDNKLHAINPNGTLKWSYTTGAVITSSPAIGADGTVYVGSGDNKLYAVNPDGTLKWSYTTGAAVSYSSPSVWTDGTVYIGSTDNKLYAVNPNGTLKWSYSTLGQIESSPAIGADGTVYVGSNDNKLYAINPDGTLKWSYATGSWIFSSPAVGADGTVYVGSGDNKLYAINPNGVLKWTYLTGVIQSSPAIGADGTVYVGSYDNKLHAVNPNGAPKWTYATGGYVSSSPAIDSDGTVYVGSQDSKLYAIDSDGALKWSYATGDIIHLSSPAIGPGGTVYVGSDKLYAVGQGTPPVVLAAKFSKDYSSGIAPLSNLFTDQSTGYPTTWSWNFGDGTGSSYQNPTKTYSTSGRFSVTLTVTDASASSTSAAQVVNVYATPAASFTKSLNPSNGIAPVTVNFADTSTGNVAAWSWNFGDGTGSSTQNPGKVYNAPGNYLVTLTVANPAGTSTSNQTLSAYSAPVAGFNASPVATNPGKPITFTDTSTGNVTTWNWNFGDGTGSSSQNPVKVYASEGVYAVSLTASNPAGTNTVTRAGYITVVSNRAEVLLTTGHDTNAYLGAVINRFFNPATNETLVFPGGIGAIDAYVSYSASGISIRKAAGLAPFSSPTVGLNVAGGTRTTLVAIQTGSTPQPPIELFRVYPWITGSKDTTYSIALHFNVISTANGNEIVQNADVSKTFRRGDANGSGSVTVTDALFIAQYLAGLRQPGEASDQVNVINSATVINDSATEGATLTIADALGIAQMLAMMRDSSYNVI